MGLFSTIFGGGKKVTAVKMEASPMKEDKEAMKMSKDPVCGMQVNEKSAPAKSEYMGKTYHFCSPSCKKNFDMNPSKYAGGAGSQMGGHGGHKM